MHEIEKWIENLSKLSAEQWYGLCLQLCKTHLAFQSTSLTPERAMELAKADADGRVVILQGKYTLPDGEEALQKAMHMVSVTNYPINRYIADAVAEKLVRDKAALEAGERDGV